MKHYELTHSQWHRLRDELKAAYGPKILITWIMKRELGFTIREHRRWDKTKQWEDRASVICVDFYSESARTFFLLKYT